MRKILILFLVVTCHLSLVHAAAIFPEKPANLKACYQAGQDWIRTKMWAVSDQKEIAPITFNFQLAACTAQAPEVAGFKWPKDYEYRSKAPYKSIFARSAQGDWVVASFTESSDSQASYLRVLKNGSTELMQGSALGGYFVGFDFAAYTLEKDNRAFAFQSAYLNKNASTISFNLVGMHKGKDRAFLQSLKEVIAFDTQKKNWFLKKCTYQIDPDPKNDLAKITEKCRAVEAADVVSLRDLKKATARPDETKTYRWNGVCYQEGEPTAWLAQKNKPAVKFPKVIEATAKAPVKDQNGIQYQVVTLTKTPEGRKAPALTAKWFEIIKGVDAKAMQKINQTVKNLAITSAGEIADPEFDEQQSKPTFQYSESTSEIEVSAVTKHLLTVRTDQSSMSPGQRSYDDGGYIIYDLISGEVVSQLSLFKSSKAFELFSYWVSDRFKTKLEYVFPKQWIVDSAKMPTRSLMVIPTHEGLQIIAGDTLGGHYMQDVIGTVPYVAIPSEWLSSAIKFDAPASTAAASKQTPLVKPHLNCKDEPELPQEQNICKLKVVSEYDSLLATWQSRLESKAGEAEAVEQVSNDHSAFLETLTACGDKDVACLKKKIKEQQAQLY